MIITKNTTEIEMDNNDFLKEYGYRRDLEQTLRKLSSNDDSLSKHAANQIKHLKFALTELLAIVEIHQDATKNNFAWAECDEAKKALFIE